jgi:hypothetical protein
LSAALLTFAGRPIIGAVVFLFYFVGGVGVRERSSSAAAVVLLMYILDAVVTGRSIVRVLFAALLFSNLRATWIASSWKPDSDAAILPPRCADTWSDKFADKLPPFLWPKMRILYYVFSVGLLVVSIAGLLAFWSQSSHVALHR